MKRTLVALGLTVLMASLAFAGGGAEEPVGETLALKAWVVEAAEVPVDTESLANWQAVEAATTPIWRSSSSVRR